MGWRPKIMCNYLIVGTGLCLPVKDALGEGQVVRRALNLLPDFPDIKLYREDLESRKYNQVADFLCQKQLRQKEKIKTVSFWFGFNRA